MYVSTVFVRILLTELRRRDWSDALLISEGLIDPDLPTDLRTTMSSEAWGRLLVRTLEMTRDPALGIALGAGWSPGVLQTVGPLMSACRSLRESIETFQHYQSLLSANTSWTLEERGDSAILYCVDGLADPLARRISVEATLASAYSIGRELVAVGSDEVWFQHERPNYAGQYSRVFACPVHFGQPHNALVFARRLLDERLPHGDQALHELFKVHADTLLDERASHSVAARVRALLRYEERANLLTPGYVADRMKMNKRTLRRALAAEHTRLSNLLVESQVRIAKKALSVQNASIKEVAHELGFSEASAFHRAFKRWTGLTPLQFVRNLEPVSPVLPSEPQRL